jgi:hypothetical protein
LLEENQADHHQTDGEDSKSIKYVRSAAVREAEAQEAVGDAESQYHWTGVAMDFTHEGWALCFLVESVMEPAEAELGEEEEEESEAENLVGRVDVFGL